MAPHACPVHVPAGDSEGVVLIRQNWPRPDAKGAFRALQPEPRPAPGAEDSPGTAFSWRHGGDSPRRLHAEPQPPLASVARQERVGLVARGDRPRTYKLRSVQSGWPQRTRSGPASSPP